MNRCDYCGCVIEGLPFKCRYCGGLFCAMHRLPFQHECPNLNVWRSTPPIPVRYKRLGGLTHSPFTQSHFPGMTRHANVGKTFQNDEYDVKVIVPEKYGKMKVAVMHRPPSITAASVLSFVLGGLGITFSITAMLLDKSLMKFLLPAFSNVAFTWIGIGMIIFSVILLIGAFWLLRSRKLGGILVIAICGAGMTLFVSVLQLSSLGILVVFFVMMTIIALTVSGWSRLR